MAQPKGTARVRVVVELTLAEAVVLARAAVVVTSALDCKESNTADKGLLAFRNAVGQALLKQSEGLVEPSRRAS